MRSAISLFPLHWPRERRSAVTIALCIAGLFAFLVLMPIPLSWMPEPIGPAAEEFAAGAKTTVMLTVISGTIGVLVGVLAALGKLSRLALINAIASFYIWIIRGTPLLVQVLFVFLALPVMVPALQLSDFHSAVVALALNVGAYNAEAIRAGILAVHRGQIEAARSLGLTRFMTFRDIVFPQAFRISLPPLVNNLVALLKDSSLAYVIGVVELSNIGNRVQSATFQPVPVFITVAVIYLILTTVMTQISAAIERQMNIEAHG